MPDKKQSSAQRGALRDAMNPGAKGVFIDNVLPGWADEIYAAPSAVVAWAKGEDAGKAFRKAQGDYKAQQADYKKRHPRVSQLAAGAGFLGGMALPAGKALTGATKAKQAVQGAKWAAGYGALSGAGEGETLAERGENAAIMGALSAPVGAAAPYAIAGGAKLLKTKPGQKVVAAGKKATQTVREVLKDTRGELTPRPPKQATKPGVLRANHYSDRPNLTETDPSKWGTNRRGNFIPPEERRRIGTAPGRTYLGLQEGEGVSRPYSKESGVGPYQYTAELDPERLYDMDADPMGLRQQGAALPKNEQGRYLYGDQDLDGETLYEKLIQDAGYGGYRTKNDSLGDVAASFDPVSIERVEKPLPGAPTSTLINGERVPFGPYDPLRNSARRYAEDAGLDYTPPTKYAPQDPEFGTQVANAYEDMQHDPADPDVAEAYQALKDEMLAQYQRLSDDGYQFSFMDPDKDPYPNPWQAIQDLRDNKKMQVYPTSAGFGSGANLTPEQIANNPLLETAPGITWGGPGGTQQPVTYNDIFRANHDAFGHGKEGFGFRQDGENAAYLQHLPTLSPPAQRALASETLGQNSWLNYGPHGEANRTAKVADTVFADQKAGLLPDELIYGGQAADFMPDPRSTEYGMRRTIPGKSGGEYAARVYDDEGLEKIIGKRETLRKHDRRKRALEAPAIIKGPLRTQPDFQYPPSYSKLRNGPRREDLDIKVDELPMADRKSISPEDLYGSTLIPGMADRTRAGGILRQVNDMKFFDPVRLQGGQDFMREQAGTGSMWAGDLSPTRAVLRRAQEAGGDVYYAPYTMGGMAGDYSTMMSDAIVEGLQRMPKGSRLELDNLMREHDPAWAGSFGVTRDASPLREQLRSSPSLRTTLAKTLDMAKWRDAGAPNMGVLRQAITEPKLADVPAEAFGYSIGKIDTSGSPILDPVDPHATYRAHLPGEYSGGMDVMVPPNLMFPDVYEKAMSNSVGRSSFSHVAKFGPPTQKADQKWLDGVMPYYEWAKSVGHLDW